MSCEKCIYIDNGIKTYFECCCEFDKIQILADDARATKDGFVYVNGRWIKHCANNLVECQYHLCNSGHKFSEGIQGTSRFILNEGIQQYGHHFCTELCCNKWKRHDNWIKLNRKYRDRELKCYACKKILRPKHMIVKGKWVCTKEDCIKNCVKPVKFVYID